MKQSFEKAYNLAQNASNMKTILDNMNEVVVVSKATTGEAQNNNSCPILFMNEYFIKLAQFSQNTGN